MTECKNPYTKEAFIYARYKIGYTQAELAEALGVSISAVKEWERGANLPTVKRISDIIEYLNIYNPSVAKEVEEAIIKDRTKR